MPLILFILLLESETPTELAEKIRVEIKEATRCTASVGISSNILLARMCTRVAKPDGCYYLSPADDTNQFMGALLYRNLLQYTTHTTLFESSSILTKSARFQKSAFGPFRCRLEFQLTLRAKSE